MKILELQISESILQYQKPTGPLAKYRGFLRVLLFNIFIIVIISVIIVVIIVVVIIIVIVIVVVIVM